jgi:hypothetical protein
LNDFPTHRFWLKINHFDFRYSVDPSVEGAELEKWGTNILVTYVRTFFDHWSYFDGLLWRATTSAAAYLRLVVAYDNAATFDSSLRATT